MLLQHRQRSVCGTFRRLRPGGDTSRTVWVHQVRGCCFSRPNEFIAEYHKPDEGRNVKGAKRRGTREPLMLLTLSGILQEAMNLGRLKQPIEQIRSPAGGQTPAPLGIVSGNPLFTGFSNL